MRDVRVSLVADRDIESILDWSLNQLGPDARERYRALIDAALADIAADADRVGVRRRDELRRDIRPYHLASSRDRVAGSLGKVRRPRHLVIFSVLDAATVLIVRVLHEAMLIELHLPPEGDGPRAGSE
jgi:toxin ParE1/3/4